MPLTLRKILASGAAVVALALGGVAPSAHAQFVNVGTSASTPTAAFNIVDYGAKCDGTTNDNTAINAALTAAAASGAYQASNPIAIVGPSNNTTRECVVNSLNLTQFNVGNGGATTARVAFSNLKLLCTGAGNTCLDGSGADILDFTNVSVRGDTSAPPEICVQVGTLNGSTSAAWHHFTGMNCSGRFTFAAYYNFGSEANTLEASFFVNNQPTSGLGPIGTLGSLTAGTSYTNGTYTNVPLTGGTSGKTSARATVVVAGGVVSSVTITYPGRDYSAAENLTTANTNVGGTGSGFSIVLSAVKPYAMVLDGLNHWRAASTFATISASADTSFSFTLFNALAVNLRSVGGGLWMAGLGEPVFTNSYVTAGASSCVDMWASGATMWSYQLGLSCEGASLTSMFLLTGPLATPAYQDFTWRGSHQSATSTFAADSNITLATFSNANITQLSTSAASSVFLNPTQFAMTGEVYVSSARNWNAPVSSTVRVTNGTTVAAASGMPFDSIRSNMTLALSCSRLIVSTYTGPLCKFQRTSDSTNIDIYADSNGLFDRAAYQAFCTNTTCKLTTWYDQSTFNNTCTQTTAASMPTFTLADSHLGNRDVPTWGAASAVAISCAAASGINDIFASAANGDIFTVVDQVTDTNADRLFCKLSGGCGGNPGLGWEWRVSPGGANPIAFVQGATTSNGAWLTTASLAVNVGHVYTLEYNSVSLATVPVTTVDGTGVTFTSPTQPVGTVSTDAANALLIGNSAATAGTRGFPGSIAEIIIYKNATLITAEKNAIRRNMAAFYGLASVQ